MTLKDLGIPDIETLEKMTDEEIRQHFSKFLEICKPKFAAPAGVKKKKVKLTLEEPSDTNNKHQLAKLQELAKSMGFKDLKL